MKATLCKNKWHRIGMVYTVGNLVAVKAQAPWWYTKKLCPFCGKRIKTRPSASSARRGIA